MSPRKVNPVENGALSLIAERVLNVPSLTHEHRPRWHGHHGPAELVVRPTALTAAARKALEAVAEPVGNLATIVAPRTESVRSSRQTGRKLERDYTPDPDGPLSRIEIWRLKEPETRNSIDESRRLREHTEDHRSRRAAAMSWSCRRSRPTTCRSCPAKSGAVRPRRPRRPRTRTSCSSSRQTNDAVAKVTILDSGYIWVDPSQLDQSHENLDERVTVVHGQWLDTTDGTWKPDKPDALNTDSAGQLDGISGHGTFIAGLISNIAPHTRLEVVGLRNEEVEIDRLTRNTQLGLFESEVAIAHAMLRRCRHRRDSVRLRVPDPRPLPVGCVRGRDGGAPE